MVAAGNWRVSPRASARTDALEDGTPAAGDGAAAASVVALADATADAIEVSSWAYGNSGTRWSAPAVGRLSEVKGVPVGVTEERQRQAALLHDRTLDDHPAVL